MPKSLTVLIPDEGQSPSSFLKKAEGQQGELLLVLAGIDDVLAADEKQRTVFLKGLVKRGGSVRIASKNRIVVAAARGQGLRVIDRAKDLKHLLAGHPQSDEALREFSPNVWRQQLRSRLQTMGLLSLPKLRIWSLIVISVLLFFFVLFKLLPSAKISVYPREDAVSQTSNIFLVQSGASLDLPLRVRTVSLVPLTVHVTRSMTFDQISKEFIGTSARVPMTIINKADEQYSLRKGSRLVNQAGMIFRIQESVIIQPGEEEIVPALADDIDLYGEIIGERGNVPTGVKWDFMGLSKPEQSLVYAENRMAAQGGKTVYRTVLQEQDLTIAEEQLKEQLTGEANALIDEQVVLHNAEHPDEVLTRLYYEELTKLTFTGFTLPVQFIGEKVTSIPVEGGLIYQAYGYDAQYILDLLKDELTTHVEEGKRLLPESILLERLVTHVIDYADDLSWIKLTVDLSGTQRSILEPLTAQGSQFAKTARERVLGTTKEEAMRVLRNLPEVEDVDITLWPPWAQTLPDIPYHISIDIITD